MMNEKLLDYIEALRTMPYEAYLPDEIAGELAQALRLLGQDVMEVFRLSIALSDGNLQQSASRMNILAGPLKDLQASLRHLTWQARQIEKGDYSQRTAFLGDFSDAFNHMATQLARREDLMRVQMEQQAEYYDALTEVHDNWRACRHDMTNHLLCLDSLLAAGDVSGARAYIEKMHSKTGKRDQDFIYTGNRVLDALLTDKFRVARKAGIEVEQSIALKRKIEIDAMDCCVLFGNALDNAIEACQRMRSDERKLILQMKATGNMLHVEIRNTTDHMPVRDGELYKSTKEDSTQHGFGLRNIKKAVESYGGIWNVDCSDGWFHFNCLLCNV